jgi:hypothetical protein
VIYPVLVHPGLTHALTFVVFALAVARVTRLVNEDVLTEGPRVWLLTRIRDWHWRGYARLAEEYQQAHRNIVAPGLTEDERAGISRRIDDLEIELHADGQRREAAAKESKLAYLVECPWCASIWVSLPAVIIWWNWPTAWWALGPAALLAWSMITGKLSEFGGK